MILDESWFVYLLLCDEKIFYVGITPNIRNRLDKHRNNEMIYTKRFSHFKLMYCERYNNKHKAALREKQLKGWSHTKKQMLIDRKIDDPHRTGLDEVLNGRMRSLC